MVRVRVRVRDRDPWLGLGIGIGIGTGIGIACRRFGDHQGNVLLSSDDVFAHLHAVRVRMWEEVGLGVWFGG